MTKKLARLATLLLAVLAVLPARGEETIKVECSTPPGPWPSAKRRSRTSR